LPSKPVGLSPGARCRHKWSYHSESRTRMTRARKYVCHKCGAFKQQIRVPVKWEWVTRYRLANGRWRTVRHKRS